MVDSPLSLEFSPRDDWNRCVEDYEENSEKCQRRFASFAGADRKYKELQLELLQLLTLGDDLWERITSGSKSSVHRQHVENLQKAISDMYANLERQEEAIKDVDSAMRKAVKQLEKTQEHSNGLMEQVGVVRKNLADRVSHMAALHPSLLKSKTSTVSKDAEVKDKKKRSNSPRREKERDRERQNGYPSASARSH